MRLQIITLVGGLRRGEVRVASQHPAGDDMIRRPVHRFDPDQSIPGKTEYREAATIRMSAQCREIVTGGEPGDLQFKIALIAPEPGHLVIRTDPFAGDAGGDLPRLVDTVLYRFEPNPVVPR